MRSRLTLVGTPTFKNFPSSLPSGTPADTIMHQVCPEPRVKGSYEQAEVLAVRGGTAALELDLKRTYPAGEIPYAEERPCNLWLAAPAKTETTKGGFLVLPGIYLAMPSTPGGDITLGKDGKTIVYKDQSSGWTYTYTLKIVK